MGMFTAAPVSRFIFTHSNRFGPLVALTSKPPSENELADVSYDCSQPSCHPTRSIRHHCNHCSTKRQWYRHVPIPGFLNLSPFSSFQDLRDQFSMFCPCVSIWQLGSHFWFLWIFLRIFPCFLSFCLCPHSWTMTCSVCLCHTTDCPPVHPRASQSR